MIKKNTFLDLDYSDSDDDLAELKKPQKMQE